MLEKHHESVHPASGGKQYKCKCGKLFIKAAQLNKHAEIHRGYKPWACAYTGYVMVSYVSSATHI